MEARASLRGAQASTGAIAVIVFALFAALLLGVAGGYLLRGTTASAPASTLQLTPAQTQIDQSGHDSGGPDSDLTRVLPIQPGLEPPYSTPRPSPIPEPTRDPNGFAVPI